MSDLTTYRLYIDGTWVDSDGGEQVEVVNPATEEIVGRVPQATRTDVVRAVAAELKSTSGDPGLDQVLSEIDLRVEVELAKAGG